MAWYGQEGRQIYYEDTGRGDPVLLLPGWGGSIVDLDRVRSELGAGFRVIAADLPGCGRSQPQPRRYPPSFYADDARAFLGLLDDLGVAAAHVVGFSDGGEVGLLMAILGRGRVLSLVAWGAAGQIVAAPGQLEALDSLIDDPTEPLVVLAAYLAEAYGADNARVMARSWAGALRAIVDAGGDVSRSRAELISCPALLLAGSYDPFAPPKLVKELADAIPRGRFLELGAGHDVHRSNPDWLATTVVDWLEGH
jgi:pimeloyl-ACP methyl ester carboxylesterase